MRSLERKLKGQRTLLPARAPDVAAQRGQVSEGRGLLGRAATAGPWGELAEGGGSCVLGELPPTPARWCQRLRGRVSISPCSFWGMAEAFLNIGFCG